MPQPELPKWKTLSSEYPVQSRWVNVRADTCETPEGDIIKPFFVFEYPNWINCIAIDEEDNLVILRQYRHGVDRYVMDLIGGEMDPGDASPEDAMRRELLEEAGWEGGELYRVGSSYPNPASHTNITYSFLVVGGSCSQPQQLGKGETLRVEKIPFGEFIHSVHREHVEPEYQALHLATIFFVENFIRSSSEPKLVALQKYLP